METKSFPIPPSDVKKPPEIERAVDRLADLLAETSEVRELVRAALELKNDPDLIRISLGIKDLKAAEGADKQPMMEALLREREALPAVKQFRRAEAVVRVLFTSVDEMISATAGLNFAENARANMDLWAR
ncbi:MAG TPA: YlbF family regulator [Bellilinea sp.]|nr:YlbF family regulator [Bellilinea sp.]